MEKANTRFRSLRRQLDERDEELTECRAKIRGLQRELKDINDANEHLQRDNQNYLRELSSMRNRRMNYRGTNPSSLYNYGTGSRDNLEVNEDGDSVGTEGMKILF